MERLSCAAEFKFSGAENEAGMLSGYASVFGVMDAHGDVVAPGAFARTLSSMKARGFNVPMYLNHGAAMGGDNLPAGVWDELVEDDAGLAFKGRLLGLDTQRGAYNYALVKGGALRGVSIGFRVPPGGATYAKEPGKPRRTLKLIDLVEVSLVDDPANPAARVTSVKSRDPGVPVEREIEDALRVSGYSNREATAMVAELKAKLRQGDPAAHEAITAADLSRLTSILRK
jgi:HK97 family phage prohead protease